MEMSDGPKNQQERRSTSKHFTDECTEIEFEKMHALIKDVCW